MSQNAPGGRILLSVLTLLVASWGVLGWFDLAHQTEAGFDTSANSIVIKVQAASPAETVGLKTGDRITHIDGIPVENSARIARQPRKKSGEVRRFTIERDGESLELGMAYGPLSQNKVSLVQTKMIIGFCFLLFPLLAFFRRPSEPTRILAIMGIGLGLAFMSGPFIADYSIRALTIAINSLFVLFGVAAMLQFLLVFPQKRPFMNRSFGKKLLYAPSFLLWLLIAYRVLFTPTVTPALNVLTNVMAAVIVGAYLLFSLYQVLRNFSRTDKAQRKLLAFNSMLFATVVALLPVTIAQLAFAFSPQSSLPGQDFYFVSLVLIPLMWSRSASR